MRMGRLSHRHLERGGSAVEAAIVTPVVVSMLFGIIEFGMLFKDYLGVQSAIRAGVRTASAEPRNSLFATDAVAKMQEAGTVLNPADVQELWVYKANPTNDFPVGFTNYSNCTTCVKFTWDYGTKKFVGSTSPTWAAASQNACTTAAGGPPDRVGVFLKVRHNSITGIIGSTDIAEGAALYLEPFPALSGCKP
jgi:Flp pilus assembly protein TadG